MRYDNKIFTNIARCICSLFILAILLDPILFFLRGFITVTPTVKQNQPDFQIVLIPLDSRPPCRDFPGQLAQIANINVIIPPPGYLDYYRHPSDSQSLAHWLTVVGPSADAVIVSVDQLVHGGLLASRLPAGNRSNAKKTLQLLKDFHAQNPAIPIYTFNIIPRLLLADTAENKPYKEDMATYSILIDKLSLAANAEERMQLEQLESIIPLEIRQRYQDMYATNLWIGQQLMSLAAQGIIRHVVLGQDDAHPYGMANMTKQALQLSLRNEYANNGNVTITRGTDEIAATLVARLIAEHRQVTPHIFVRYSWSGAARTIMPYMPNTVEQTVEEKIAIVKGVQVHTPEEADFILYVHIGTPHTPPAVMQHAAKEIKQYMKSGHLVSLVDLSKDYNKYKNLFPYLEKAKIELSNLVSYSGWNTTSNSVGTAVAHAVIYHYARQNDILLEQNHHAYLFQRFWDDWYYQKRVQPELNWLLTKKGVLPVDLGEYYETANDIARKKTAYYAGNLYSRYFKNKICGNGILGNIQYQIQLPWPRTFEIQLDVSFTLLSRVRETGAK